MEVMLQLSNGITFTSIPTCRCSGGAEFRELPEMRPKMLWVDEAKFFAPYTPTLIEARQAIRKPDPGRLAGFKVRMSELKAFYEGGGGDPLILGADNPTSGPLLPGFSYHREMQAWAASGITPVATSQGGDD
jgi:hypothetical protein